MGAWGIKPWDNDGAGDWFANLIAKTGLAQEVEEVLKFEMEDGSDSDADVVRAAAAVLILLGHIYVWSDDLEQHLRLAISRLEEILERGFYSGSEEWQQHIRDEIQILKARLNRQSEDIEKINWWFSRDRT